MQKKVIKEEVGKETALRKEAQKSGLIGMNDKLMVLYIKFCADRLLLALGRATKYYNVANPFEWMDLISMEGKSNFFERRVGDYQKAGVMPGADGKTTGKVFTLESEF